MIILFLVGLLSGAIMGLIGIGGGAFLVPLLLLSGLTFSQTISIVLFTQLIPQTLPAFLSYNRAGIFPWKEGIIVTIGSFIGVTGITQYIMANPVNMKILYRLASVSLFLLSILIWIWFCR